jgi:uncharacterized membrane protein YsdA (DUF1294 family)
VRRQRSTADFFLLSLAATFLATLSFAAFCQLVSQWIGVGYFPGSVVTFAVYAWDKHRAQNGEWRVAENTLHFLDLLGGWPGALVAQRLFRHKTRKLSFQIVFWLIVTIHFAIWGWLIAQQIINEQPAPVSQSRA